MSIRYESAFCMPIQELKNELGSTLVGGEDADIERFGSELNPDDIGFTRHLSFSKNTLAPCCSQDYVDMAELLDPNNENADQFIDIWIRSESQILPCTVEEVRRKIDLLMHHEIILRCLHAAKEYREWQPPKFDRVWKTNMYANGCFSSTISNAVYRLAISLEYYYGSKPWTVHYDLMLQDVCPPSCHAQTISCNTRTMNFATREEADSYLTKRKKYFEKKYFSEDYPPVPKQHTTHFMWAGRLLPGYRVGDAATQN